jgi:hypothetical protein
LIMGTKASNLRDPASCLNKAAPDEPLFVLRAKDPTAAQTVRLWAEMNEGTQPPEKIRSAIEIAAYMDKWRKDREPKADAAQSGVQAVRGATAGAERRTVESKPTLHERRIEWPAATFDPSDSRS